MYFLLVLLVYLEHAQSCPAECHCSTDYEYEEGVLVDCENLFLSEIPYSIPSHVSTLLLSYNNLQSLEGLQYYNNLRALELQQNNIRALDPVVLQSLPYLKILVLSENDIRVVPSRVFRGLEHLEWVDLRGNKISHISSDAFYKANNINYLNLVANELDGFQDGTFLPLTNHNLWLVINNNSLTELPKDISKMEGIQYLSISNNLLTHISPNAFQSNANLRTLDISQNSISYLHQGTFTGLSIQKLEVAGNPWQCDCYVEWLRLYLITHAVEHSLFCATPPELEGVRLSALQDPLICIEPVIAAPEPEVKIMEYRNTSLECVVTGDSFPLVVWYKDSEPLEPQANRYTEVVGSRHRLVFRSVMYTDDGVYSCIARNTRDEQTNDTITLSVLYSPKIINSYKWSPIMSTAKTEDLSDVTLACDVISNPPLNRPVAWFKESSELLGSEPGIRITRTDRGSILLLSNAPDSDNSGQFRCEASNPMGTSVEHFSVTTNDILMVRSSAPASRRTAGTYHHHITPILLIGLGLLIT